MDDGAIRERHLAYLIDGLRAQSGNRGIVMEVFRQDLACHATGLRLGNAEGLRDPVYVRVASSNTAVNQLPSCTS